jgi:hypothetical protein
VVGIPHLRGENRLFQSIFPHFLHFPTESFIVPSADASALVSFRIFGITIIDGPT